MAARALPEWESDAFWGGQDFEGSARLHMQHWIWQYQTGYVLHPDIKLPSGRPVKVADIGCGNAAWLLEMSKVFPTSDQAELDGFDITSNNFPHTAWLPSNIHLQTWNAFTDVPAKNEGVYDIVHLRLLQSAVTNNAAEPLINNALKLLKPGGYLHWDENDSNAFAANVPSQDVEAPSAKAILTIQNILVHHSKVFTDWIHNLPQTLREKGCEVLCEGKSELKKELARASTENYLLVFKDVARMLPEQAMPLPPGMGLSESLSRQSYVNLLKEVVKETSQGVSLTTPYYVTVARKGM